MQIKCRFNGKNCNSNQSWNNDKYRYESKNKRKNVFDIGYIWNPATCGRYVPSITDDCMITCDEIIETTKSILTKTVSAKFIATNFNEKTDQSNEKFLYFTCPSVNYPEIINSCYYLLLHQKILGQIKTFFTVLQF